jgi:hypothetical protein
MSGSIQFPMPEPRSRASITGWRIATRNIRISDWAAAHRGSTLYHFNKPRVRSNGVNSNARAAPIRLRRTRLTFLADNQSTAPVHRHSTPGSISGHVLLLLASLRRTSWRLACPPSNTDSRTRVRHQPPIFVRASFAPEQRQGPLIDPDQVQSMVCK